MSNPSPLLPTSSRNSLSAACEPRMPVPPQRAMPEKDGAGPALHVAARPLVVSAPANTRGADHFAKVMYLKCG